MVIQLFTCPAVHLEAPLKRDNHSFIIALIGLTDKRGDEKYMQQQRLAFLDVSGLKGGRIGLN